MLSLAIAVTVADGADSIGKFIGYHLRIGFSVIYLFVDDNDEATIEVASRYRQVTIFCRDRELENRWSQFQVKKEEYSWPDREVMIRQELNFHVAFNQAKKDGVDWLLHIDLDELFYPNGMDLQAHFKDLQINNYRSITYLNLESIVTSTEAESIYESSKYFKINYFRNKHWFYNEPQLSFIKKTDWLSDKFFRYYQNGKSCVSTYGNDMHVYDVHSIFGDGKRKVARINDPLVLHFPCATYEAFKKKYVRLGLFSDNWRGIARVGNFIDDVHLRSRDIVMAGVGENDIKEFYRDNFVLSVRQIEELMRFDLVREISFHLDIFGDLEV